MGYYINLSGISVDSYKTKLKSAYLPPSRMVLKEKLEERFMVFKGAGINNVEELRQLLKKKDKFEDLSKVDCLASDYLVILLREINSMLPRPNKLKDFPGISPDVISKVEDAGIKDTLKLFPRIITVRSRNELAGSLELGINEVMELTKLTDLSRIKWVGVTFARMLYDIGIDTVEKASKTDPAELHKQIININKEKNYYKGQIGMNDIRIFVDAANEVPLKIEYE